MRLSTRLQTWLATLAVTLVVAAGLVTVALVVSFHAVPLPERLSAPGSPVVTWRDGRTAHVFLAPDDRWRVPVGLDEIDPDYVDALVRLEDKRFWSHPGIDPVAIGRAAALNLARGRVVSGGSTLTMQVVRVVEPRPRTLRSKVVEAWRALQLEWFLSKEQILEAYLTFTPYGRNVEGLEAAALATFGHSADALAADEIATLLAVPQAPSSRYPTPENADRLRAARDGIAAFLADQGALPRGPDDARLAPDALLAQVRARPVPRRLRAFPRALPVVAPWLRRQHPDVPRIHTTLDPGVQATATRTLTAHRAGLASRGIHQGVAVVADHDSGEILALVGSLDPGGEADGDQVAMFDVPRSPGSALKPFLYARALDEGIALPDHLVRDVPASYHGYAPRNYDGTYDGLVRLEDALSRSLNLPFVFLLDELGVEPFLATLRRAGARSLVDEPGWYGLSVAAGGIELTPVEVTGLYATLAADGRHRPLRLTGPDDARPEAQQVFSHGASWLTRRALRLRDRPDFPARRDLAAVPVGIHWKTGTSFGHRDAWACGSGPAHTACVWLGNADMSPSRHLVGAQAAGAPLFDLLEAVGPRGAVAWADPIPADLTRVEVDAWSGYLPTAASPSTRSVWALRQAVPPQRDPFHVQVEVDEATGQAVNAACRGERSTRTETFVVVPAAVRRWLSDQHRRLPQPPRLADGCRPAGRAAPPRILSPGPGEQRVLIPGLDPSRQEIPLEADTATAGEVSWFVDGDWLGTVPAERRMWWTPTPGVHTVTLRDEAGRTATVRFSVRQGTGLAGR